MNALRVLIAEDDAMIGMMLAEALEDMGHVVCAIAATEADAVAAAIQHRPNLLIVDANLQKGSGVLAVKEILRAGPIPCVFVTGDSSKVRALESSAVVLEKPFREVELFRAIERALGGTSVS